MSAAAGILVVDKPAGMTSHDVVAALRRITGIRRIGHAGTLDPLATGVLPMLVGAATRMAEYVSRWPKTYRFTMRLGVSTDTYDAEGRVTRERDPSHVTAKDIEAALPRFRGDIRQVPPPYSAVKVGGRPLYAYARAERAVAVEDRPVRVDRLEVLDYHPPDVNLIVECGSGTYARSIAHELGEALGCGAHVTALQRTAVGPLTLGRAVTLEAVAAAAEHDAWTGLLLPPDLALADAPAAMLGAAEFHAVVNGRSVVLPQLSRAAHEGDLCRAYDGARRFVAVLRYDAAAPAWHPHKVFFDGADSHSKAT